MEKFQNFFEKCNFAGVYTLSLVERDETEYIPGKETLWEQTEK